MRVWGSRLITFLRGFSTSVQQGARSEGYVICAGARTCHGSADPVDQRGGPGPAGLGPAEASAGRRQGAGRRHGTHDRGCQGEWGLSAHSRRMAPDGRRGPCRAAPATPTTRRTRRRCGGRRRSCATRPTWPPATPSSARLSCDSRYVEVDDRPIPFFRRSCTLQPRNISCFHCRLDAVQQSNVQHVKVCSSIEEAVHVGLALYNRPFSKVRAI